MKTKLCIDCNASFEPTSNHQSRCPNCRIDYSGRTGRGHRVPLRTIVLTEKANAGIDLARRNMWRRALGLEELEGDAE